MHSLKLFAEQPAAFDKRSGVTAPIFADAMQAARQAQPDSLRIILIIAAPFGAMACVAYFFLSSLGETMNYRFDQPTEDLHAKHERTNDGEEQKTFDFSVYGWIGLINPSSKYDGGILHKSIASPPSSSILDVKCRLQFFPRGRLT